MKCLQIDTEETKLENSLLFLIAQFQEYPEDSQVENKSTDLWNYLAPSYSVSSPEQYVLCVMFTVATLFHSKEKKKQAVFISVEIFFQETNICNNSRIFQLLLLTV